MAKKNLSLKKKDPMSECTMTDVTVKLQIDISLLEGVEIRLCGTSIELAAALATAMDSDKDFAKAAAIGVKMYIDKANKEGKINMSDSYVPDNNSNWD